MSTTNPQLSAGPKICCKASPQQNHNNSNKWKLSLRLQPQCVCVRVCTDVLYSDKVYRPLILQDFSPRLQMSSIVELNLEEQLKEFI
jgi:hypothetical protein